MLLHRCVSKNGQQSRLIETTAMSGGIRTTRTTRRRTRLWKMPNLDSPPCRFLLCWILIIIVLLVVQPTLGHAEEEEEENGEQQSFLSALRCSPRRLVMQNGWDVVSVEFVVMSCMLLFFGALFATSFCRNNQYSNVRHDDGHAMAQQQQPPPYSMSLHAAWYYCCCCCRQWSQRGGGGQRGGHWQRLDVSMGSRGGGGSSRRGGGGEHHTHWFIPMTGPYQAAYEEAKRSLDQNAAQHSGLSPTNGTYTSVYYAQGGSERISFFSATQLNFEPMSLTPDDEDYVEVVEDPEETKPFHEQQDEEQQDATAHTLTPFCWRITGHGNDSDGSFVISEGYVVASGHAYWIEQSTMPQPSQQQSPSHIGYGQLHHYHQPPSSSSLSSSPYTHAAYPPSHPNARALILNRGKFDFTDNSFTGSWIANSVGATERRHHPEFRLQQTYVLVYKQALRHVVLPHVLVAVPGATMDRTTSPPKLLLSSSSPRPTATMTTTMALVTTTSTGGMRQAQSLYPTFTTPPTSGVYRCCYHEKGAFVLCTVRLSFELYQHDSSSPSPQPPHSVPSTVAERQREEEAKEEITATTTTTTTTTTGGMNNNNNNTGGAGGTQTCQVSASSSSYLNQYNIAEDGLLYRIKGHGNNSMGTAFVIVEGLVSAKTGKAYWIEQEQQHVVHAQPHVSLLSRRQQAPSPASSLSLDDVPVVGGGDTTTTAPHHHHNVNTPCVLSTGTFSHVMQDFVGWRQGSNDAPSNRYQDFSLLEETVEKTAVAAAAATVIPSPTVSEQQRQQEQQAHSPSRNQNPFFRKPLPQTPLPPPKQYNPPPQPPPPRPTTFKLAYEQAKLRVQDDIASLVCSPSVSGYYYDHRCIPTSGTYTFSYHTHYNPRQANHNMSTATTLTEATLAQTKKKLLLSTVRLHFEAKYNNNTNGGEETTTDAGPAPSSPSASTSRSWTISGLGKNAIDGSSFTITEGRVSASGKAYWVEKSSPPPTSATAVEGEPVTALTDADDEDKAKQSPRFVVCTGDFVFAPLSHEVEFRGGWCDSSGQKRCFNQFLLTSHSWWYVPGGGSGGGGATIDGTTGGRTPMNAFEIGAAPGWDD